MGNRLLLLIVLSLSTLSLTGCRSGLSTVLGFMTKAAGEERTAGSIVDDSTIHAELTHYFVQTDVNDLLMNVTARVYEGRVMLTGSVKEPKTAREAVRLSWIAKGVTEVINNIETTGKASLVNNAKDQLIEGQIEGRLLTAQHVRSLNYTVEVENGVVYLLGLAQSAEELRKVAHLASISKGVQKVVSYVRVKDDPRNEKLKS